MGVPGVPAAAFLFFALFLYLLSDVSPRGENGGCGAKPAENHDRYLQPAEHRYLLSATAIQDPLQANASAYKTNDTTATTPPFVGSPSALLCEIAAK